MAKKMSLIENQAKGIDLIVERDSGNPVRILTGKNSKIFFTNLRNICDNALQAIENK